MILVIFYCGHPDPATKKVTICEIASSPASHFQDMVALGQMGVHESLLNAYHPRPAFLFNII